MSNTIEEFYEEDEDFKEYVHREMETYNKTKEEVLVSPITQAYWKSMLPGGCNYREEQE